MASNVSRISRDEETGSRSSTTSFCNVEVNESTEKLVPVNRSLLRVKSVGCRREIARKRQSSVPMTSLSARYSSVCVEHVQDGDRQLSCATISGDVANDVTWNDLANVTRLEVEDASDVMIASLAQRANQLTRLSELSVTWTPMKMVPAAWLKTVLPRLKLLSMVRNQLCSVDGIETLHQLQQLNLSFNLLTTLPRHFGRSLESLTSLNLAGNHLRHLPDSIGHMTALQSLELTGNRLTQLPGTICDMTSLVSLGVSGNLLTSLPVNIGRLAQLEDLRLSGNKLDHVPSSFAHLGRLHSLIIANNHFSVVPVELSALASLRLVNASGNSIATMDCSLPAVRTLILDNNGLTAIPRGVFLCSALEVLSLENNQINAVPNDIRQLANLRTFNLAGNNAINSVPDGVGDLARLHRLTLRKTGVKSLPAAIADPRRQTIVELTDPASDDESTLEPCAEYSLE